MALQKGAIFDGKLLNESDFVNAIQPMLRDENSGYFYNLHNALINFENAAGDYSPADLAAKWENIHNTYFGASPTHVIITTNIPPNTESTTNTISFYSIDPQSKIYSEADEIKKNAKQFEIIYKAGTLLTKHWQDLLVTVNKGKPKKEEVIKAADIRGINIAKITEDDKRSAHGSGGYFSRERRIRALLYYIENDKSKLYTYKQDLYSWLGGNRGEYGLGKLNEVFVTHLFNLHHSLNLNNISTVYAEENKTNNFYNLLLEGIENNRPWFTGGDYILISADNNSIQYNIQFKSTVSSMISYNNQLTRTKLINLVKDIRIAMDSKSDDQIARTIYKAMETAGYVTRLEEQSSKAIEKTIASTLVAQPKTK